MVKKYISILSFFDKASVMRLPALLVAFLVVSVCQAADIAFPSNAGVVDVTQAPWNAKGNGVNDDSTALENAIHDTEGSNRILYVPAGTYRVTRPISFRGGFWISLNGAGKDRTIIKLDDNCPGYGDVNKGRWVLSTIDDPLANWTTRQPDFSNGGFCNVAFQVFISDLTIDTGAGNPSAIALHFISNNGGGLRHVQLRSGDRKGLAGLDLRRAAVGPCIFSDVTIDGFDHGVMTWMWQYNCTFERLALQHQNIAGFTNNAQSVAIRGLTSVNAVPSLVNLTVGGGPVVIDGASCTGGSSAFPAIRSLGPLIVRGLSTSGYRSAINQDANDVPGPSLPSWSSAPFADRTGVTKSTLFLPVQDPPDTVWEPRSAWVDVASYIGADRDLAPALEAACATGASTLYLRAGSYEVKRTAVISGAVRWLHGCSALITCSLTSGPVLRITGLTGTLVIDKLRGGGESGSTRYIEHAGGDLVLRDCLGLNYQSVVGAGDLHLDSVVCGAHSATGVVPFVFDASQRVWARDLNSESQRVKIQNNAATLWILGWKTEGIGTSVTMGSTSRTEILGGLVYPTADAGSVPAFSVTSGAKFSIGIGFFGCNEQAVSEAGGKLTYTQIKSRTGSDRFLFFSNSDSNGSALAPLVSSAPTPTMTRRPTWTWVGGGGGDGSFRWRLDNPDVTGGETGAQVGYTPSTPLAEGTHTLYVQEHATAGSWSTTGSATVVIDATPPAAPPAPMVTGNGTDHPTLSGTAESGARIRILVDGVESGLVSVDGNGAWTWPFPANMAQGNHTVVLVFVDAAGNASAPSAESTVTIAAVPPSSNPAATSSSDGGGCGLGIAALPLLSIVFVLRFSKR